jgi:hypothetical protein
MIFLNRVIRIGNGQRKRIPKGRSRLFKRDTMLFQIRGSLSPVPPISSPLDLNLLFPPPFHSRSNIFRPHPGPPCLAASFRHKHQNLTSTRRYVFQITTCRFPTTKIELALIPTAGAHPPE